MSAAILLVALAAGGWRPPAWPAREGPSWPAPPDTPRVRYVQELRGPRDVGAGPSWLGRAFGAVFGRGPEPRIFRPHGIATDSAGRVFVADSELRAVHVFDPGRRKYSQLEPAPFATPIGVAVGANDIVYVSDAGRRLVFAYGRDGKMKHALGAVNGEQVLVRPTGLAVDSDGLVYVVDTVASAVVAFTPEGRVAATLGGRGGAAGRFHAPTHIAIDRAGRLYVVDSLNARVQVLQRDGTVVRTFGSRGTGTGDLDKPKGIGVDSRGHVYVVEGLHDVVQVFDGDGRLLLVIGGTGEKAGEFSLPTGLHIDRGDRIYVADAYNRRVQVLQYLDAPTGAAGQ